MSGFSRGSGGAAGALTLIQEKLLAAPSLTADFTAIPNTYRHLLLFYTAQSDRPANTIESVTLQFNGDTGNNYDFDAADTTGVAAPANLNGFNVGSAIIGVVTAAGSTATAPGMGTVEIPYYAQTTWRKAGMARCAKYDGATGANHETTTSFGWHNAAAINRLTLKLQLGNNFVTGSIFSLYGVT